MSEISDAGAARPAEAGRLSAIIVYGLYLLSIPSAATFALLGVVIAYFTRAGAAPWVASHLTAQIRWFWIALALGVVLFALSIPAWALTLVLIGFPLLWLLWAAGVLVLAWFTIASLIGLLTLLADRPMRR